MPATAPRRSACSPPSTRPSPTASSTPVNFDNLHNHGNTAQGFRPPRLGAGSSTRSASPCWPAARTGRPRHLHAAGGRPGRAGRTARRTTTLGCQGVLSPRARARRIGRSRACPRSSSTPRRATLRSPAASNARSTTTAFALRSPGPPASTRSRSAARSSASPSRRTSPSASPIRPSTTRPRPTTTPTSRRTTSRAAADCSCSTAARRARTTPATSRTTSGGQLHRERRGHATTTTTSPATSPRLEPRVRRRLLPAGDHGPPSGRPTTECSTRRSTRTSCSVPRPRWPRSPRRRSSSRGRSAAAICSSTRNGRTPSPSASSRRSAPRSARRRLLGPAQHVRRRPGPVLQHRHRLSRRVRQRRPARVGPAARPGSDRRMRGFVSLGHTHAIYVAPPVGGLFLDAGALDALTAGRSSSTTTRTWRCRAASRTTSARAAPGWGRTCATTRASSRAPPLPTWSATPTTRWAIPYIQRHRQHRTSTRTGSSRARSGTSRVGIDLPRTLPVSAPGRPAQRLRRQGRVQHPLDVRRDARRSRRGPWPRGSSIASDVVERLGCAAPPARLSRLVRRREDRIEKISIDVTGTTRRVASQAWQRDEVAGWTRHDRAVGGVGHDRVAS